MKDFKIDEKVAKDFGEYLKKIREGLGYSTNKVELDTGISKSDLSRIENGLRKQINPFYLKELAKLYKRNVLEFQVKLGFIDDRSLNINKQDTKKIKLPVYEFVTTGNGTINFESFKEEEYVVTYDLEILDGSCVLEIKGENMEPLLYDNDKVMLEPLNIVGDLESWKILNNRIVLVKLNDETYLREVIFISGKMFLYSFNEDLYPEIEVRAEDQIECKGMVTFLIERDIRKIKYNRKINK